MGDEETRIPEMIQLKHYKLTTSHKVILSSMATFALCAIGGLILIVLFPDSAKDIISYMGVLSPIFISIVGGYYAKSGVENVVTKQIEAKIQMDGGGNS